MNMLQAKRLLLVSALSGPAFLVFAVLMEGRFPRSTEWSYVFLQLILGISLPMMALAAVIVWLTRNPTARLHSNEGMKRLALLALASGPIWFAAEYWLGSFRIVDERGYLMFLYSCGVSIAAWLAVNVIGWAVAGFSASARE